MKSIFTSSVLALSVIAVSLAQDSASPFGPLTTNNGVNACVQFGSCTDGQSYATTETQQVAVTPPASSVHIAPPTNAAESSAYISYLAASGASAAYASRVANGQGKNGAADGATSSANTSQAVAGTAPSSVRAPSQSRQGDGAIRIQTNAAPFLSVAAAAVAVVMGGAFIL